MFKTIIIPITLAHPEKSGAMIEAARALAAPEARFILTNIVDEVPGYVEVELPAGMQERSRLEAEGRLGNIARDAGLKAEIVTRIGHPANAILAVADENDADAIIIASHKPGLQDYLLGSTAARVVRHATCAVLVLR